MTDPNDTNPSRRHHSGDPGARQGLLNEALLCDLLEGHLNETKAESAQQILARDPVLNDTIAQLRHDRDVLRSMGDEMCPADMFSRLEPAIDREALIEAEAHEAAPVELRPASRVSVSRQRTWRVPAAALATAAGLVVVSGVVLLAQQFLATLPDGPARVAQSGPGVEPAPINDPPPALPADAETTPSESVIAQRDAEVPAPLIDRPSDAIRLARSGRAEFTLAGVSQEEAPAALAGLNAADAPWRFEGLDAESGPIFCMIEPRPEAWTQLTAALAQRGITIQVEETEPTELELTAEQVLWWEQRTTWSVPRTKLPVRFEGE